MSKPIVAYYRVSADRQGIRGLGIEAQQAAVEQYARVANGNILAEYREAESGRKSDRPQLREALKHARRAGAVLVVAKLDPLSRNLAFLSALMPEPAGALQCGLLAGFVKRPKSTGSAKHDVVLY